METGSRPYNGNVGDEYDAWTEEGILEYYVSHSCITHASLMRRSCVILEYYVRRRIVHTQLLPMLLLMLLLLMLLLRIIPFCG
jgi:hypothetical protein